MSMQKKRSRWGFDLGYDLKIDFNDGIEEMRLKNCIIRQSFTMKIDNKNVKSVGVITICR